MAGGGQRAGFDPDIVIGHRRHFHDRLLGGRGGDVAAALGREERIDWTSRPWRRFGLGRELGDAGVQRLEPGRRRRCHRRDGAGELALPWRIEKEVLAQKSQRLARFALDVLQRGKSLVFLRRGVTVGAILAEAHVGRGAGVFRRPIHRPAIAGPAVPTPEPAVVGDGQVAHHDGGAILRGQKIKRIDAGAGGARRRVHFLHDHGAVGNRLLDRRGGPFSGRLALSHA